MKFDLPVTGGRSARSAAHLSVCNTGSRAAVDSMIIFYQGAVLQTGAILGLDTIHGPREFLGRFRTSRTISDAYSRTISDAIYSI